MSSTLSAEGRAILEAHGIKCLLQWLKTIRKDTEEYDPVPRPQLLCEEEPDEPLMQKPLGHTRRNHDESFDKILSQIGHEIYKLDEYQSKIENVDREVIAPIARTIVDLFDVCLCDMSASNDTNEPKKNSEFEMAFENNSSSSGCDDTLSSTISEYTELREDCTGSENNLNVAIDTDECPPVPPRRKSRKDSQSSLSSLYDNIDRPTEKPSPKSTLEMRLKEDLNSSEEEDSESTRWSYKQCANPATSKSLYQSVWTCKGGFHRSDEILREVLERNNDSSSCESLEVVNTRSRSLSSDTTVAAAEMEGLYYEPLLNEPDYVNDENIYEEIRWEVKSVSVGGSVEYEWRPETPQYVNLSDPDAYTIPLDVIAWRNLLLDPYYNDDEEDEWITPEESLVFSKSQQPPIHIPRITSYTRPFHQRPSGLRRSKNSHDDLSIDCCCDSNHGSVKDSVKMFQPRAINDWSPVFDNRRTDFFKSNSESPTTERLTRLMSTSNENLLDRNNFYAASSSGDSLDVELRSDVQVGRTRKTASMVSQKPKPPVPTPRVILRPELVQETKGMMVPTQNHGLVKRTKLLEAGKKAKKNWCESYLFVAHTALIFFKDVKTFKTWKMTSETRSPPSPTVCRAAEMFQLKGCAVAKCTPQHTSRYPRSLVVSLANGDQILIADESPAGAAYWLQLINQSIHNADTGVSYLFNSNENFLEQTTPASIRKHAPEFKNGKVGDSSNEDLSDSTESTSNVRAKLRKFFMRRPTVESLMKKGIYKDEPVFGRRLEEVCPEKHPRVPEFVVRCVQKIESNEENMKADGLYRASGNLSQVQKIRLQIDQNNMSVVENSTDIHELAGSLKLFFRELKEPLIPFHHFQRVLTATTLKTKEARIKEFRHIVNELPPCNKDTLRYLLQHLIKVTEFKEHNRMEASNLAIVFGPTLLWGPTDSARNIARECFQQNHVIEILLNDYALIFSDCKT